MFLFSSDLSEPAGLVLNANVQIVENFETTVLTF